MYLRIRMKTKLRQLHFRGRSTLHKIGEFYLSDHGRQPQFRQKHNFGSQQSKNKKLENNKLLLYIYAPNPFHGQKMRENYFLSRSRVNRFQWDCHLSLLNQHGFRKFLILNHLHGKATSDICSNLMEVSSFFTATIILMIIILIRLFIQKCCTGGLNFAQIFQRILKLMTM